MTDPLARVLRDAEPGACAQRLILYERFFAKHWPAVRADILEAMQPIEKETA